MKKLTKKQATRRVRDLQDIMDACYEAAGVIVSARFDEDSYIGWKIEGGIRQLDAYVNRLEMILRTLSRSQARTVLTRELFAAVIRGDLTVEDVKEGSQVNGQSQENEPDR